MVPRRLDAQCRERWFNVEDPDLNKGPYTAAEVLRIIYFFVTCVRISLWTLMVINYVINIVIYAWNISIGNTLNLNI